MASSNHKKQSILAIKPLFILHLILIVFFSILFFYTVKAETIDPTTSESVFPTTFSPTSTSTPTPFLTTTEYVSPSIATTTTTQIPYTTTQTTDITKQVIDTTQQPSITPTMPPSANYSSDSITPSTTPFLSIYSNQLSNNQFVLTAYSKSIGFVKINNVYLDNLIKVINITGDPATGELDKNTLNSLKSFLQMYDEKCPNASNGCTTLSTQAFDNPCGCLTQTPVPTTTVIPTTSVVTTTQPSCGCLTNSPTPTPTTTIVPTTDINNPCICHHTSTPTPSTTAVTTTPVYTTTTGKVLGETTTPAANPPSGTPPKLPATLPDTGYNIVLSLIAGGSIIAVLTLLILTRIKSNRSKS